MTTKVIAGAAQNAATKDVAANRVASGKLGEVAAIYQKSLAELVSCARAFTAHTIGLIKCRPAD